MNQNLVVRIGLGLALIFNATAAGSVDTAGTVMASAITATTAPVAVFANHHNRTDDEDASLSLVPEAGSVPPAPPRKPAHGALVAAVSGDAIPCHLPGVTGLTHLKLTGSYDRQDSPHVMHLVNTVLTHLRDDAPTTARRVLEASDATAYLDPEDLAALQLRVAAGLLYDSEDKAALLTAGQSLEGKDSSDAHWVAGLAAFRLGRYEVAQKHFIAMATLSADDPWIASAAAFWTGRAVEKTGTTSEARPWFEAAAMEKSTFYSLLAEQKLTSNRPARVQPIDGAPYPIPQWKPHAGFTVDPALLYAIMRQESRFDPKAASNAGAIGLMQIMPQTAIQITARKGDWNTLLLEPETNLDLGQRYVETLLARGDIANNLMMLAAAYNSGPGHLARWRHDDGGGDPLLFLETLPAMETRGFIEQMLSNYWVYRARLGEDTVTLDDLAAGKWPVYRAPAPVPTVVAQLQ